MNQNRSTLYRILYIAALVFLVYLAVRYLWPVLLIAALLIAARVLQTRRMTKNAEEEAKKMMRDNDTSSWQDDLFRSQAGRMQQSDIIDAEYTERREDSDHD
ncbi:MAG: hypothetical protein ACI4WR_06925 [Bulleidia sp.]